MQLFGGFLIALDSLPQWLQWLKYGSFFRYGTEASVFFILRTLVNTQDMFNPGIGNQRNVGQTIWQLYWSII